MTNKKHLAYKHLSMKNPYHVLATGLGSGLIPFMPGTMGTLMALPIWWLLSALPTELYTLFVILAICFGVYICHRAAKDMGVHDHGSIVWDEFIGIWITLITLPAYQWQWIVIAVILFRLLDIFKPWPIRWFDRQIKGGMGIMIDDIIAGVTAALILWVLGWLTKMANLDLIIGIK